MRGANSIRGLLGTLALAPGRASLLLVLLALTVYLPGIVRLPAVDRTEVIFAETTRDMVARGDWTDPRFAGEVHAYRPIGTFWAQGVPAVIAKAVAGDAATRDIRVYRIPGLIAVTLAVLAIFWLGRGIAGSEAALVAAGLFAVAPLVVLVSQLAIAEGLSLLPATIAMLALARLYAYPFAPEQTAPVASRVHGTPIASKSDELKLALVFWAATGAAMLINALLVPILITSTLMALFVMDRDLSWLKRLRPLIGIPLALAIAAPWILVRAHQDGVPFAGLGWFDFFAALGGAQDMKLRAFPGTFLLALLLGFLPGTALLGSATARLWIARHTDPLARFLLAWVIGYLIYLEALSSKPGTYMVQTMYPALALAVAGLVVREEGLGHAPRWHGFFVPTFVSFIPVAVFAAVYAFAGTRPTILEGALIIAVASLFAWSARQGREGLLRNWSVTSVAALGLFAVTLLAVILPGIDKIWPAREISRAVANCPNTGIGLIGFREPSGRFVLGAQNERDTIDAVTSNLQSRPPLTIIEDRWVNRMKSDLLAKSKAPLGEPSACVSAFNVMRGCSVYFRIYRQEGAPGCDLPPALACADAPPPAAVPDKPGRCD